MVRLPPGDGARPIELFRKDEPCELVRQRPRGQLKRARRGAAYGVVEAVRAADHERDVTRRVTRLDEERRELGGAKGVTTLVAAEEQCPVGNALQQTLSLTTTRVGRADSLAARFPHLGRDERPVARRTRLVLRDRRREMPIARLPHGGDDESHGYA